MRTQKILDIRNNQKSILKLQLDTTMHLFETLELKGIIIESIADNV